MKRVVLIILIFVLASLVPGLAQAAELTLDDCINTALEKRAPIIEARGNGERAGAARLAAWGAFLPSLSASYSYNKGKETDIEPGGWVDTITGYNTIVDSVLINGQPGAITELQPSAFDSVYRTTPDQDQGPNKNWFFRADIDLLNARTWFNLAATGAAEARANLLTLSTEQDLILSVKRAYYDYLSSMQRVTVQEEAVKRAAEQLKLIESRYELGSASKSDLLKQRVQHGNDRLAHLEATNEATVTEAALAYTIGLDLSEGHTFSTEYRVREYSGTLDEAIAFGLSHNPGLLSSERYTDETAHSVRAAKAGYLPRMSAYANYNKSDGTVSYPVTFERSSNSWGVGFQVSMNIFDGFLRERSVTNARVNRNNSLAALSDSRNYVARNVQAAFLQIDLKKQQVEVSQENVVAAEEDLRITQEKYNLGAGTILDLLVAQVSLRQAQVSLIRVEFDLNLAIAQLENAMGKM